MGEVLSEQVFVANTPKLKVLKRALNKALIVCFDHTKPGGMTPAEEKAWKLEETGYQSLLKAAQLRYESEIEINELLSLETTLADACVIGDSMVDASEEMLNAREVCRFFGGAGKPIDVSTLYRGIKSGRYPKAIRIGPKINRWSRSECQAALDALLAAREAEPS